MAYPPGGAGATTLPELIPQGNEPWRCSGSKRTPSLESAHEGAD